MHASSAFALVFAVGALSVPSVKHKHLHHQHKARDLVVETEIAYATAEVTETVWANGATPAPQPDAGQHEKPGSHHEVHVKAADSGDSNNKDFWKNRHGNDNKDTDNNQNGGGYKWYWHWGGQQGGQQLDKQAPQQEAPQQDAPTSTAAYQAPPSPPPQEQAPEKQAPPSTIQEAPQYTPPPQEPEAPQESSDDSGSSNSGDMGGLNDFQQKVVTAHNQHRANHSSPDIQYSTGLENAAKMLAQQCSFDHNTKLGISGSGFDGYGQNLAAGVKDIADSICNMWYNGEINKFGDQYGEADPSSGFEGWGHFTQVIWKDTTHVGCYSQDCSSQGIAHAEQVSPKIMTVCNYGPPGNMQGDYANNVQRPKNEATKTGDAVLKALGLA